ncbi:class I SAM-dependent methyltransferase [Desulfosarcina variabilis]|uniref:class I SAM-dependent methyltransferase n=1 Tax=Desulfosarcina variabilis TaxID=2300 RepID=UPI003AFA81FA
MNKHTDRNHHSQGTGRGPSSFWMHDSNVVFDALALKPGDAFLDLGCGPGDYAMAAARIVGPSGTVLAFDKWPYLIDGLKDEAASLGIDNIQALGGDITQALPIADHCIDCCMLATVLHIFGLPIARKTLFREVQRILKPSGRLAIIESKKEDQPFGPPLEARISPGELEASLHLLGYRKINYREFEYTYLIQFDVT